MRAKDNLRTAAEVLVDQLRVHGVDMSSACRAKAISRCSMRFMTATRRDRVPPGRRRRMMAEAVGKATGRPGSASSPAVRAPPMPRRESTSRSRISSPLIDVRRPGRARHARARGLPGARLSRGVRLDDQMGDRVDDPARVPEMVSRAFHVAANGRPGPVVIAIPEDMLVERVAVADAPPFAPIETSPGPAEMEKFAEMLGAARAPILLLGGSRWSQEASDRVARFAQKYALPVRTTFRRGHLFDPSIPVTPAISASGPIRNCSSGSNPPISSCSSAAGSANCRRRATRCSTFRGRRLPSCMSIRAPRNSAGSTARILRSTRRRRRSRRRSSAWTFASHRCGDAKAAHADYLEWTEKPTEQPGGVNFGAVVVWLREIFPPMPSSATAPAILRRGSIAFSASAVSVSMSRRRRARWAMACRRRSP